MMSGKPLPQDGCDLCSNGATWVRRYHSSTDDRPLCDACRAWLGPMMIYKHKARDERILRGPEIAAAIECALVAFDRITHGRRR